MPLHAVQWHDNNIITVIVSTSTIIILPERERSGWGQEGRGLLLQAGAPGVGISLTVAHVDELSRGEGLVVLACRLPRFATTTQLVIVILVEGPLVYGCEQLTGEQ